MEKFKEFFKNPYNVIILVIMILYVVFGLRSVTNASELVSDVPIIDYGECGSDYEIDLPNGKTFVLYPNGKYLDCPYVIVMYNADRQSACAFYSTSGFYRYNNESNSFMSGQRYYKAYSDGTSDSATYVSASSYIGEPIFWSNHNVLNPDKQTVFFFSKYVSPDIGESESDAESDSSNDTSGDWWNNGGSGAFGDWFGGISQSLVVLKDSITSSLTELGNNILNGLKDLFIPTFSPLLEIRTLIDEKLPPLDQLLHIFGNVLGDTSENAPTFSITYKGQKYNIVDFSVFTPYRPILLTIQSALYLYLFIRWYIKFYPSMISGIGGVIGK